MAVYAILLPQPNQAVASAITAAFPDSIYPLSDTQWFVSTSATDTVYDVSAKIKIYDPKNPQADSLGNAVILPVTSYYGKAPATLWDWLKARLEARQSA